MVTTGMRVISKKLHLTTREPFTHLSMPCARGVIQMIRISDAVHRQSPYDNFKTAFVSKSAPMIASLSFIETRSMYVALGESFYLLCPFTTKSPTCRPSILESQRGHCNEGSTCEGVAARARDGRASSRGSGKPAVNLYRSLPRPCLAPFPSSFLVNNADPFTRLISSLIEYAP